MQWQVGDAMKVSLNKGPSFLILENDLLLPFTTCWEKKPIHRGILHKILGNTAPKHTNGETQIMMAYSRKPTEVVGYSCYQSLGVCLQYLGHWIHRAPRSLGRAAKKQCSKADLPLWFNRSDWMHPWPLHWDTLDWIRAKATHVNKAFLPSKCCLVAAKFGAKITYKLKWCVNSKQINFFWYSIEGSRD